MISKFLISMLLRVYLNLILITCKFKIHGEEHLNNALQSGSPIMLPCWHNRLVFLLCFFKTWRHKLWVLSSQHRDSEILASILKSWNFNLVRGSSSHGWFGAIKEITSLLNDSNAILAVTIDGPKGPPLEAKPGALKIALKKQTSVIGMTALSSCFWSLNTWDKLKLPKPFSVIHIAFDKPYEAGYSLDVFNQYLTNHQIKLDKLISEDY